MASEMFAPPRGMRDFYPEDMVWRDRVFAAWRRAALAFGFRPYDACVVESLDLLRRKSGEEVAEQIYHFEDKSGRPLALRPEMTPTLARMIAARHGRIPSPVKWFAIAQCFRYERMTRGRKREHYQWNMDVVGEPGVTAEAEVMAAAAAALEAMGMPPGAYRIHVNSRALLGELLDRSGIPRERHAAVFLALDKRGKIPDDAIAGLLRGEGLDEAAVKKTFELLAVGSLDQAAGLAAPGSPAVAELRRLFDLAGEYGIADRLLFDISVIRGLSYYTGIVFEAFDTERRFRAIFGGGRYDNLLTAIGGAPTPAVGLGFGDVVVTEILKDLLGPEAACERNGVAVGYMEDGQRGAAMRLARALREAGERVDLALARQKPRAFFSRASAGPSADAVYIGPDDVARGAAKRKHLATGEESEVPLR